MTPTRCDGMRIVSGKETLLGYHPDVYSTFREIRVDVDLNREGVFAFLVSVAYELAFLPQCNTTLLHRTGKYRVHFPGSMLIVALGKKGPIPLHERLVVHARTAAATYVL